MTVPNRFTRSDVQGVKLNQNFGVLFGQLDSLSRFTHVRATGQFVPTAAWTTLDWSTVVDGGDWVVNANEVRPPAGAYVASAFVNYSLGGFTVGSHDAIVEIRHNSTIVGRLRYQARETAPLFSVSSIPFRCDGATDVVTVRLWQNTGANRAPALDVGVHCLSP